MQNMDEQGEIQFWKNSQQYFFTSWGYSTIGFDLVVPIVVLCVIPCYNDTLCCSIAYDSLVLSKIQNGIHPQPSFPVGTVYIGDYCLVGGLGM